MFLTQQLDLRGKQALVCGASQGIGQAIAAQLAELGASVILLARQQEALDAVRQSLACRNDQQHHSLALDLAISRTVSDWQTILAPYGRITLLINNSGGPAPGPLTDAEAAAFMNAFQQHLLSSHGLLQALLPGMREAGYGRIINILSTSVKQPIQGLGVSNTLRAAMANWAKTLAYELGPSHITVNNILPGATATPRLNAIFQHKAEQQHKTLEEVMAAEQTHIPLKRFAQPEEIAYAVAFLASPAANYITGINLPIDGGRTLCL